MSNQGLQSYSYTQISFLLQTDCRKKPPSELKVYFARATQLDALKGFDILHLVSPRFDSKRGGSDRMTGLALSLRTCGKFRPSAFLL